MHTFPAPHVPFRLLAGAASLALLSGCASTGITSTGVSAGAVHLAGVVHGGQQPIAGATIQLYTVGTSATGASSTALISSQVQTLGDGTFSITGDYSCADATQVYIVASGGDPGAGANPYSTLATALGSCSSLSSSSYISINELTTVAAAYALAPFAGAAYTSIGSAGSVGLPNAFLTAATLVDPAAGTVNTSLPSGLTVPVAEIDTLADILASCVNSNGSASAGCSQLNTATGATNTFDAAFFIAKNPGAPAVVNLYSLQGTVAPFQPVLPNQPNDFTLAVSYTGSTSTPLSTPFSIAIDGSGNAFVTDLGNNTVTAISPLSSNLTTGSTTATQAGGFSSPRAIAIDTDGYFWIANAGAHNVVELAPLFTEGGAVANFTAVPSRAISGFGSSANPVAIVTDTSGNAYTVSLADNSVYAISNSGTVSGTLQNASLAGEAIALSNPITLAVGNESGQICTLSTSLSAPTCTAAGSATVIDDLSYNTTLGSVGYAGIGNNQSFTTLPLYGPSVGASSDFISSTSNGGPGGLAFDGAGYAYMTFNGALYEYNNTTSVSPANGYDSLPGAHGVAIDPSGNVWVANANDSSLSIFVGLAAPTLTPIAANLH